MGPPRGVRTGPEHPNLHLGEVPEGPSSLPCKTRVTGTMPDSGRQGFSETAGKDSRLHWRQSEDSADVDELDSTAAQLWVQPACWSQTLSPWSPKPVPLPGQDGGGGVRPHDKSISSSCP